MGTVGNSNPWAPYNTYKDCSQGICSIYCPQYCYLIFPPPPSDDDDSSSARFSPLIIAIISVLASALLLVIYYTLVTRFCRGRRQHTGMLSEEGQEELGPDRPACHAGSTGLDKAMIETIEVRRYRKGEGVVEGSECVVCLNEFQESEALRILPKCSHAFHVPCIDTWLGSHSVCPLCRANIIPPAVQPLPLPRPSYPESRTDNMFLVMDNQEASRPSYPESRTDNVFLVMDDQEGRSDENIANDDHTRGTPRESPVQENGIVEDMETKHTVPGNDQSKVKLFRRSSSLGSLPCPWRALDTDVMNIEKNDELEESGVKRSFSAGRLSFADCNKGKKSVLPY